MLQELLNDSYAEFSTLKFRPSRIRYYDVVVQAPTDANASSRRKHNVPMLTYTCTALPNASAIVEEAT